VDDDIRNARAKSFSLGFSQELRANLALHLDGAYTEVEQMTQTANINTPVTPTGPRPRPTWGRIVNYQSGGKHEYRALFVRLDKRFANRHQYLLSYTLAKQDNQGPTGLITDFYNPGLDWGPGDADRRHTWAASGSVLLPYDVTLGGVWTLRSSRPFSARAGRDLNNDGAPPTGTSGDYVPGATSNMGNRRTDEMLALVNTYRAQNGRAAISADQIDSDRYNRLDVRASKAFSLRANQRVEIIAQVFNLLGTDSLGGVNTTWVENALSNSFGRMLTVHPRQLAELAVRYVW
jgi:hypothetical protein